MNELFSEHYKEAKFHNHNYQKKQHLQEFENTALNDEASLNVLFFHNCSY